MFMVNTGEHYCHSMKDHDSNSPATCLASGCDWKGERKDLVEVPRAKKAKKGKQ